MKKRSKSLALNLIIVVFEIIAFIVSYICYHRISFEYYTEDSNILLMICCSIFAYYIITGKSIPKWLHVFKYIVTTCVAITFMVVVFILAPMYSFNYPLLMFSGTMLFHHTICPILAIITFLCYDNLKLYKKKDIYLSLSFTFIYAIVAIILNILKVLEGPYPFLMVRTQPILISIIWVIVIIGFAAVISFILKLIHTSIHKEVLDVYNDEGLPINKVVLRGSDDSAFLKGEHFAVSVIFIENNKGEYLIQKLPDGTYSSTGGHVLSEESPLNAIIREVGEEIGIRLNKKNVEYLGFKIIDLPIRFLFYTKKNINIKKVKIDRNEVYSVEYMTEEEIKKLIKNNEMKESHAILFKELLKYKKNNL